MKVIEFYKEILTAGNLVADGDGYISAAVNGAIMPFTVSGKRLVLPTREHIKNPDWSNRVVFHPLVEDMLRGESKVLEKFRNAINVKLNVTMGNLLDELLNIVLDIPLHSKMTPDQAELLTKVKNADDKTKNALTSIIAAIRKDSQNKCIVRLFSKRGGLVKGRKYNRATVVAFPLYTELKNGEKTAYGVPLRIRDREAIIGLLEFMMPGIETEGMFNYGSISDIAPFLDAILRGLINVASRINTIVHNYGSFMSADASGYTYFPNGLEALDNLNQFESELRAIPMQAGNEGTVPEKVNTVPVVTQPLQVAPPVVQQYNQPQPPQAPQQPATPGPVLSASGGIDFAATMRSAPTSPYANTYAPPRQLGPVDLRTGPYTQALGPMYQPMQQQYPQQYQQFPQQQYNQYQQYPQQQSMFGII